MEPDGVTDAGGVQGIAVTLKGVITSSLLLARDAIDLGLWLVVIVLLVTSVGSR